MNSAEQQQRAPHVARLICREKPQRTLCFTSELFTTAFEMRFSRRFQLDSSRCLASQSMQGEDLPLFIVPTSIAIVASASTSATATATALTNSNYNPDA